MSELLNREEQEMTIVVNLFYKIIGNYIVKFTVIYSSTFILVLFFYLHFIQLRIIQ